MLFCGTPSGVPLLGGTTRSHPCHHTTFTLAPSLGGLQRVFTLSGAPGGARRLGRRLCPPPRNHTTNHTAITHAPSLGGRWRVYTFMGTPLGTPTQGRVFCPSPCKEAGARLPLVVPTQPMGCMGFHIHTSATHAPSFGGLWRVHTHSGAPGEAPHQGREPCPFPHNHTSITHAPSLGGRRGVYTHTGTPLRVPCSGRAPCHSPRTVVGTRLPCPCPTWQAFETGPLR